MFRPTTIVLALMSGGALVSVAPALMRNDCSQARANRLPNAEEICARHSTGGHSSSGWYGHGSSGSSSSGFNRTGATTGAAVGAAVASTGTSRGGFGAAGAHASAGG